MAKATNPKNCESRSTDAPVIDDIGHINEPALRHHAHQGKTKKHFVAHRLGRSRRITAPSSEYLLLLDHPANSTRVNRQTGHHQEEQNPDV